MSKYRNEWKFCCSEAELELLKSRLTELLHFDRYSGEDGQYCVRSIYFDDYTNTCARQNEAGLPDRYKWRIRYYANVESKYIHLEKKVKHDGRGRKYSCALSEDECRALIAGRPDLIIWQNNNEVLRKFCFDIMTKHFVPKVIIEYDRIAFVEPISDIRVTFDMNISASNDFEEFLEGTFKRVPLQEKQRHVLEVKFDDILPSYIRNIVESYGFKQTSFSKYYNGRKAVEGLI